MALKNSEGGIHIELNDEPMASVGVVREVFKWQRDYSHLRWPCYQVSARFDGGMSGGPVFDETGCLCGIVCSNVAGSHIDNEPLSYVTTLWPLFRLILSQDRGDKYPRGAEVLFLLHFKDERTRELRWQELQIGERVNDVGYVEKVEEEAMTVSDTDIQGGCLCGEVRYRLTKLRVRFHELRSCEAPRLCVEEQHLLHPTTSGEGD